MRSKLRVVTEIREIALRFHELQQLEDVAREPGRPFDQLYTELTAIKNRREYWSLERDKLFIELGQIAFLEIEAEQTKTTA